MSDQSSYRFPYHYIPAFLTLALLIVWILRWINPPPGVPEMPAVFRIARFSNLLPCFLGFFLLPSLSRDLRILLALVSAGVLGEVATWIAIDYVSTNPQDMNLLWIFHIFTIAEFIFLMMIFNTWHMGRRSRKAVSIAGPVVLVILIAAKMYQGIKGTEQFDSFATTIEGIVVVTLAVLTLIYLTSDDIVHIFEDPRFWVVSAIMFYFAGNLIIFALGQEALGVLRADNTTEAIWTMHSALNITANCLYAYSFYLSHKKLRAASA
ncbi:MAG: hypothetical protein HY962_02365 [Ignavibacteriae bacterium]|nr:hypothetical protein [Ignavibacteriota bacterium]